MSEQDRPGAGSGEVLVRVVDLVYDYPRTRALKSVSLTLPAGSITALVGPNGAGKTTLLRCLASLERPLSGALSIAGIDVVEEPQAVRRQIGFLSDGFGLYGDLTVRQCLDFFARSHGLADPEQAVTDVATRLSLVPRLDSRAGSLSRGWRQRVGIAQAVVHGPRLLLLDEPASGLDPQARGELAQVLRELRSGGMTIVVSSHILAELADYSTHMMVLDDGRLVEYRPIQSGTNATEARWALVRLLEPAPDLPGVVARVQGCVLENIREDAARIRMEGGAELAAELLATLIGAGVRVTHFDWGREDLQQAYLDIIRRGADR